MLLADLVPGSFVSKDETQQTLHSDCDWQNDKLKYQDSQIREMPSWLKTANDQVVNYNFEKLSELGQPIARINAWHSTDIAKKSSPDEMSGLEPVISLEKEAHVMLTMNLWTDVGFCNGATGTVVDFIYANSQQPPDLPFAVIVKFNYYKGPSISNNIPGCVPRCPITASSTVLNSVHERQQLPLKLAWAITIHKSQGLTLSKAWIDIRTTERTAGISYVAISSVRALSSCILEPMTFERLTSLKKYVNLKFRLQEEKRLDELASRLLSEPLIIILTSTYNILCHNFTCQT